MSTLRAQSPHPTRSSISRARLVKHIDDHAINILRSYYQSVLPPRGRILDLCSSWISHLLKTLEDQAAKGELEVIGAGMNAAELAQNGVLARRIAQDLNVEPNLPADVGPLDGAACVVSIDYFTRPLEVLRSLRSALRPGAQVHLVVSKPVLPDEGGRALAAHRRGGPPTDGGRQPVVRGLSRRRDPQAI
jgi:hypothetical protein